MPPVNFFFIFVKYIIYLNRRTRGEKTKIWENPRKNGRVDRYANKTIYLVGRKQA